ncbi:MAG: FAD-dependent oxidoreductase [Candidatus Saccharibacteria bacterium]|nr:FAD-dependent oxidoreductase [Candidatus Saccharibacteria bacterium]
MKRVKTLILGGGLSGLSAALFLGENADYLILEKDNTAGGYCRTIANPVYVWDYAGHFYHFQTEKYQKLFASMVEPEEIVYSKKNTKILYNGTLIEYPFQMNIHQLPKEDFIECLYDLYTKESKDEYSSFLDMLYGKFGRATTEKFLKPYNEKLYATDLQLLDKDAMGRFFPYADFDAIIRNMKGNRASTYNDEFLYLKKGTGYFIDKLVEKIPQDKILYNTTVKTIDIENKTVTTEDGEVYGFDNLISSIPFNLFLRLSNNIEYQELSKKLSYNKVLVFNLGFDKKSPNFKKEHWIYFPDKKLNFYRIGFYDNILNQDKLSVYVEIGFSKNDQIDIEKELKETLEGMKKVGIIDDDMKLMDSCTLVMDPAYVHISNTEKATVENILQELRKKRIFNTGRYGSWTYNSMEDCMTMAENITKTIKDEA